MHLLLYRQCYPCIQYDLLPMCPIQNIPRKKMKTEGVFALGSGYTGRLVYRDPGMDPDENGSGGGT